MHNYTYRINRADGLSNNRVVHFFTLRMYFDEKGKVLDELSRVNMSFTLAAWGTKSAENIYQRLSGKETMPL